MIKRLTSFTHHRTGEGDRISYTFSDIDDNGNVIDSNKRASLVLLDKNVLAAVSVIENFLQERLDSE